MGGGGDLSLDGEGAVAVYTERGGKGTGVAL